LPDEEVFTATVAQPTWQMYFDGACRKSGAGAGVIFVTPDEAIIPYSFTLISAVSNNAAEYEALIIGLETAYNMGQYALCLWRFPIGNQSTIGNIRCKERRARAISSKSKGTHIYVC
jgi:hypothetical protein